MSLSINWFKLDISPEVVRLPTRHFAEWDETTALLTSSLRAHSTARWQRQLNGKSCIALAILSGPDVPDGWNEEEFNLYETPTLARRLAQIAFGEYFRNQAATVHQTRFDLIATRHAGEFADIGVLLKTGIRMRFFAPEAEHALGFTANWEVRAEFNRNLDDARLRDLCLGMSVILNGNSEVGIPTSLVEYMNRFVGKVVRVVDKSNIEIWARTDERIIVPSNRLRLEATPAVMRELERQQGNREQARSIFRRIQELKLVLVNGRRNLGVFRDQLRAIRHFFARDAGDSIVFPASCGKLRLSIALTLVPAKVEIGGIP